jgi:hypothetical protein
VKRRDYRLLMADIRRLRPVVAIVLTIVFLLPSFDQMVTQDLSPLTVLTRLAEAFALVGTLVWLVSGVVLHYARTQVAAQARRGREDESHA